MGTVTPISPRRSLRTRSAGRLIDAPSAGTHDGTWSNEAKGDLARNCLLASEGSDELATSKMRAATDSPETGPGVPSAIATSGGERQWAITMASDGPCRREDTDTSRLRPDVGEWPAMKFDRAIDQYVEDMRRYGRINSARTEHSYYDRLLKHGKDVGNRDPRLVGRNDVKRTLARWQHPNTQRNAHAILISFYDWAMEEGIRETNPARQVRKAKKRETSVYRLTREEVVSLFDACHDQRERRMITLGVCAGARNQELRGLKGEHFQRDGFIWFSPVIAKGKRERWVPVLDEAVGVVEDIRDTVGLDHYVIPARRPSNPPINTRWKEYPDKPSSPQAIWRTVG